VTTPREDGQQLAADRRLRGVAVSAFARLPPVARRSILHALGKYAPWEDGFDSTPPQLGRDEVTGPPDFVGIGAQKAGTTWWFDAICAHPDVYSRADIHKERHFFGRYATRPFGPAQCSLYHDWFPRPPGTLTGEWTPDYIHCPWAPPLLAEAAPDARLLVLLRDPVERFRSGIAHDLRDRGNLTVTTYQDAVARGLYHDALRRWAGYFPPEQFLILQYEHCRADPAGQLDRTYRFLGLEPFVYEGIEKRVNVTAEAFDLEEDVRRRLVELYESDVRVLSQCFPDLDLTLWPNFAATNGE
jgi:Sulfotransferase domain